MTAAAELASVRKGDAFVALGRLVSMEFADGDEITWPARGRPLLAEHLPSGDLWILEGAGRPGRASRRARDRYDAINWGERDPMIRRVDVRRPGRRERLDVIGVVVCVTYESDKSGEIVHWYHAFRAPRPTMVQATDGTPYLVGGGYRVTPRGIVG